MRTRLKLILKIIGPLLLLLICLFVLAQNYYVYYNGPTYLRPNQVALVTYFAPQINPNEISYYKTESYTEIASASLTNMLAYTTLYGIPFFYRNAHMVDSKTKSAYWSKMPVIRQYLNFGYEWVIWTDLDVIFVKFNRSLITEWLNHAQPQHHMAFVEECDLANPERKQYGSIRSGFFAVRNTHVGRAFLSAWEGLFDKFRYIDNPEQSALEFMIDDKDSDWKSHSFISAPDRLHTYPSCYEKADHDALSIHYVATHKKDLPNFAKTIEIPKDFEVIYPDNPQNTK